MCVYGIRRRKKLKNVSNIMCAWKNISCRFIHTHTHTHTNTQTHTPSCLAASIMHIYIYIYTHTYTHTHTHIQTHMYIRIYFIHTQFYIHMCTNTNRCLYLCFMVIFTSPAIFHRPHSCEYVYVWVYECVCVEREWCLLRILNHYTPRPPSQLTWSVCVYIFIHVINTHLYPDSWNFSSPPCLRVYLYYASMYACLWCMCVCMHEGSFMCVHTYACI
jgi:hypothetical protein